MLRLLVIRLGRRFLVRLRRSLVITRLLRFWIFLKVLCITIYMVLGEFLVRLFRKLFNI
jgi:hypothetical protein